MHENGRNWGNGQFSAFSTQFAIFTGFGLFFDQFYGCSPVLACFTVFWPFGPVKRCKTYRPCADMWVHAGTHLRRAFLIDRRYASLPYWELAGAVDDPKQPNYKPPRVAMDTAQGHVSRCRPGNTTTNTNKRGCRGGLPLFRCAGLTARTHAPHGCHGVAMGMQGHPHARGSQRAVPRCPNLTPPRRGQPCQRCQPYPHQVGEDVARCAAEFKETDAFKARHQKNRDRKTKGLALGRLATGGSRKSQGRCKGGKGWHTCSDRARVPIGFPSAPLGAGPPPARSLRL